jgi:hypothetical protein
MRSLIEPEPVLVDIPRGERTVRIRPVFRVGGGAYAVVDSVPWEEAGTIFESATTNESGQTRHIWRGITATGIKVKADTRADVVAALLEARDEFAVTIDDTIPTLFEIEE